MTTLDSRPSTTTAGAPGPRRDPVRRARIAVSLVFVLHGSVTGTFITRIPWLQHHLHLSPAQLGIALLCPAVGASLAMPLASRLVHRFGNRVATQGLLTLWCLSVGLPALMPNLYPLMAALLGYGAVAGMADVAMNAQGVEVEQRLGRSIMSGLHGMWSVGVLVASGFGVLAAHQQFDPRLQLGITALVLAGLAQTVCTGLLDLCPAATAEAPPRFALPPRSALAVGLLGFCGVFAEGASLDWSGIYLRDVTGASASIVAACSTAFAATMTLARLTGDLAIRRFGPVTTVRAGGAVATLGSTLVVLADRPYLAITGFALIGIGIATIVPLAFAAAGHSGPNPSQSIAGVATITYISGLVAPAVVGGIAQATSLAVSFGVVTALAACLVLGATALRPKPGPATGPATGPTED
ncbi:MFS transporter [Kitasatospora sp. MMS16-BH015]|uniref:MFS transporter n=1 Tax=Kitasatospora sp. MMS16-BH015 TaxID=2018025 RepID=UPI000CA1D894|nr:MFS transporter [Kitasatospora sp. MMS16-BH015]AUG75206.1 MFS transporter [Kitasatospora sp. MMS16-BH015]